MRYLGIVWGPGYPHEQVGAVPPPTRQRIVLDSPVTPGINSPPPPPNFSEDERRDRFHVFTLRT